MSAYEVDPEHITALLVAGLAADEHGSPLSWFETDLDLVDEPGVYEQGQALTMAGIELAQRLRRELTWETAGRVGRMLVAQNRESVNHRYGEEELEELYEEPRDLLSRLAQARALLDPARVLGAIGCYEYQACEGPSWARSEAAQFVDALRRTYIRRLPGYRAGEVHQLADLYRKG